MELIGFLRQQFGAGCRITPVYLLTLGLARLAVMVLGRRPILAEPGPGRVLFLVLLGLAGLVVVWSIIALPPRRRGVGLCTAGPFRFVRHPLYSALLVFFTPGVVFLLNDYLYALWAVLQYPLFHLLVGSEEKALLAGLGEPYRDYMRRTNRFLPRLF